jgi:hypothetical protein
MMRYESSRKYDNAKAIPANKSLGFNYYIEQLHQITIEQKIDAQEDEDLLDFFAQLLRLLRQPGEAFLDAFFAEAQARLGADIKKTYPALQRMQIAGLVDINEGKVLLTNSGKELMDEM